MENHRKPNSKEGHKSKLVTRREAGFYLAKKYLREAYKGLGPARGLGRGGIPPGFKIGLN